MKMSSSEPCLRTSLPPLKPAVLATVQSLFSSYTCILCTCLLKVTQKQLSSAQPSCTAAIFHLLELCSPSVAMLLLPHLLQLRLLTLPDLWRLSTTVEIDGGCGEVFP